MHKETSITTRKCGPYKAFTAIATKFNFQMQIGYTWFMALTLIVGHDSMDADCLGSMALAKHLFPGAIGVLPPHIHPMAKWLLGLFGEQLGLRKTADLVDRSPETIVVVDTRSQRQVHEVFSSLSSIPDDVRVIDHHPSAGEDDIPNCSLIYRPYGAAVSILCELLADKGMRIPQDDATLALAGLQADTGNFSHDNVNPADFQAAAWLLSCGASVALVRKMTNRLPDYRLMDVFHLLLASVRVLTVRGHRVIVACVDIDAQSSGLSFVAERLAEVEAAEATFCIFRLLKEHNHLIVARSARPEIDVARILGPLGGGGHAQAASVLLKRTDNIPIDKLVENAIEIGLEPAPTARDLMDPDYPRIGNDWTMLKTALWLEERMLSGAPVCDEDGKLCGMFSLRDLQRGRHSKAMQEGVAYWMDRQTNSVSPDCPSTDIEKLFMKTDAGRLPVVQNGSLLGVLVRSDCLKRM